MRCVHLERQGIVGTPQVVFCFVCLFFPDISELQSFLNTYFLGFLSFQDSTLQCSATNNILFMSFVFLDSCTDPSMLGVVVQLQKTPLSLLHPALKSSR